MKPSAPEVVRKGAVVRVAGGSDDGGAYLIALAFLNCGSVRFRGVSVGSGNRKMGPMPRRTASSLLSRAAHLSAALGVAAAFLSVIAPGASAQTLGTLTPLNCFSTSAVTGCTAQPGLDAAGSLSSEVTLSPDGRSAYAVMSKSTLVQFAVQNDGSLAYVTCIGDATLANANPCPVAAPGIKEGDGSGGSLAVSPDGAHLYVTGFASDTVAVFRRDTAGATLGRLTSEGCLANAGLTTCDAVPGTTQGQVPGLDGPVAVAISGDGAHVYVAALSSNTVVAFKRDTGGPAVGRLTANGCLANTGVATCDAVPGSTKGRAPGLSLPDGVAISPDQANVYVTGVFGTIAVLTRDTGGATAGRLVSDGCLATTGSATCDGVPGSTQGRAPGIGNPQQPVVSPDGRNVYVASQGSIAVLKRDGTGPTPGRVVADGCLAAPNLTICDGVAGSTSGRAPATSASAIALTPDAANLYSADFGGSRIGSFSRRPDGGLTFDGCLANTGDASCDGGPGATRGQAPGILRPSDVTVAPDARSLYVASDNPGSVVSFARFVPPTSDGTPPAGSPPTGAGRTGTPPFPAKLAVLRARVASAARRLDVLAPITTRASGRVNVSFQAAGRTIRFTAPVDATRGRVRINRLISARQARLGTGILTISYPGDADTQPQVVRLRAASRHASLRAQRPKITNGRLTASGRISTRASGVVRVQLLYEPAGQDTVELHYNAKITRGRYTINQALPASVLTQINGRRGVVHSYTLFTGYQRARMRGEMASYQVLPTP